jgi:pimeloyl-ACP methyl ester carboxylesterase
MKRPHVSVLSLTRFVSLSLLLAIFLLPSFLFAFSKPPVPVIFLHGLGSSADGAWGEFRQFLISQGWTFGGSPTVFTSNLPGPADFYTLNFSDFNIADFPSQHLTLSQQGMEVNAVIQAVLTANPGKPHVILVGHSMGGLASRNYLQGLARVGTTPISFNNNVVKLVTVGTPHDGSELAADCSAIPDVCLLLSPFLELDPTSEAISLLTPGNVALNELNNVNGNPLPATVNYVSVRWRWHCHSKFAEPQSNCEHNWSDPSGEANLHPQ